MTRVEAELDGMVAGVRALVLRAGIMRLGARRRAAATPSSAVNDLAAISDPAAEQTVTAEVYGLVLLTSALAAARSHRADDARAHLTEAGAIASRTGERTSLRQGVPARSGPWVLQRLAGTA